MKTGHRYIIYILTFIILVFGLVILFWRNEVFNILHNNSGIYENNLTGIVIASSSKDAVDVAIFDDAKFIVLKNNLNKFDFDTICRDVSGQLKSDSNKAGATGLAINPSIKCSLGNNKPFAIPIKIEAPTKDGLSAKDTPPPLK